MTNQKRELIVYMAHDRGNGYCYFGSTFQGLSKRIADHLRDARTGRIRGHFYSALAKRPHLFEWFVLEKVLTDNRDREEHYLKLYVGMHWCYNQKNTAMGAGTGDSNCGKNPETVKKRKKKYAESVSKGTHLFQDENFRENNSKRQKDLANSNNHNFSKGQGPGVNNAYSNKSLWRRYEKIKGIWEYYQKPGACRLSGLIGVKESSLARLVESFKKDSSKI